jgi:hypothetical protein
VHDEVVSLEVDDGLIPHVGDRGEQHAPDQWILRISRENRGREKGGCESREQIAQGLVWAAPAANSRAASARTAPAWLVLPKVVHRRAAELYASGVGANLRRSESVRAA